MCSIAVSCVLPRSRPALATGRPRRRRCLMPRTGVRAHCTPPTPPRPLRSYYSASFPFFSAPPRRGSSSWLPLRPPPGRRRLLGRAGSPTIFSSGSRTSSPSALRPLALALLHASSSAPFPAHCPSSFVRRVSHKYAAAGCWRRGGGGRAAAAAGRRSSTTPPARPTPPPTHAIPLPTPLPAPCSLPAAPRAREGGPLPLPPGSRKKLREENSTVDGRSSVFVEKRKK